MSEQRKKLNFIFYIIMGVFWIFTVGFVDSFGSLLFFGIGGIAFIVHGIKGLKTIKK